jgi:hypothetical protein
MNDRGQGVLDVPMGKPKRAALSRSRDGLRPMSDRLEPQALIFP